MRLIEVKNRISNLGVDVLQTHEVAKILDLSNAGASLVLHRLEKAGEVLSLKKGLWLLDKNASPFYIGEQLARPYSAYVSLQSALYLHGLISQIPQTYYFVTLARSGKRDFLKSHYSYHRLEAYLFEGFELKDSFNLATPEKALFDTFYFSATRDLAFKSLPELELPKKFSMSQLSRWCKKIKNPRLKSHVQSLIEKI
ncbi:MAG: hypothetical protein ACK5Y2_03495 [Bdellovibrionales bacterium]